MIYAGTNITSNSDKLSKVNLDYLYNSLIKPKPNVVSKLRQLQIVRNLDQKQYATLKRQLPYIVCGAFSPPFRRTENFAYTEYFIVDLDHLTEKGLDITTLRKHIEKDDRLVMSFISPSMDGLKLIFKLKEKCYDSGLYSLFYKTFVRQLAIDMGLEQVVDTRTSDVCRACFISADDKTYYNKNAYAIDINAYINMNDSSDMFKQKKELDTLDKANNKIDENEKRENPIQKDPDAESLQRIKQILNPKARTIEKNESIFVPEQLNEILGELKKYIEETGVILYEVTNIQYGKKLKIKLGMRLAEINIFYGKRGFSVIISPRCGTNAEFNQMMAELIEAFIFEKL